MHFNLRILSLIGLTLSIYASYVEVRAERDKDYVALCDISEKVSCTAAFNSKYGKGFGVLHYVMGSWTPPNGVLGVVFYVLLLLSTLRCTPSLAKLRLQFCVMSFLLSFYLAYLLYFVLSDLCLVCVSIYLVNYFCLWESWKIHFMLCKEKFIKARFLDYDYFSGIIAKMFSSNIDMLL